MQTYTVTLKCQDFTHVTVYDINCYGPIKKNPFPRNTEMDNCPILHSQQEELIKTCKDFPPPSKSLHHKQIYTNLEKTCNSTTQILYTYILCFPSKYKKYSRGNNTLIKKIKFTHAIKIKTGNEDLNHSHRPP